VNEGLNIFEHFSITMHSQSIYYYTICALNVKLYLLINRVLYKYRHSLTITVEFYFSEELE